MPTNKNAFTRYVLLDKLLSNRYHCYTLDDLLNKVNEGLAENNIDPIGRRCLEKDIQYLEYQSPMMVEIERYFHEGRHCLRYARQDFSIFKQELSDEEKYLLKETIGILGQFDGLPNLEALERLRNSLSTAWKRPIVSFTKNSIANTNLFGQIFTAISQKQVIEIQYKKFNTDTLLHFRATPYLLKEYNRRWFLISSLWGEDKILTFALDRIQAIVLLPGKEYHDCEDIETYFEDIIGVTHNDTDIQHILFWASDVAMNYIATKPLHDSQRHYKSERAQFLRTQYPNLPKGGAFFSIECIENYELLRELSSFGAELLVLEPLRLQEKLLNRAKNIEKAYESLNKM